MTKLTLIPFFHREKYDFMTENDRKAPSKHLFISAKETSHSCSTAKRNPFFQKKERISSIKIITPIPK
jgi:hypothetical protein